MSRTEIKISGFGGQGIILTGYVIGKAASIFDDKHATLMQSFGPEARGGAASAQVIVSADRVLYPYVTRPSILLTLSQEAYDRFSPELDSGGLLLYEEDLVKLGKAPKGVQRYGIPATRLAEKLGRKIVLNMVMLGFFTALTDVVSTEAMKKGIKASVPRGTEDLNIRAFDAGLNYGAELLKAETG